MNAHTLSPIFFSSLYRSTSSILSLIVESRYLLTSLVMMSSMLSTNFYWFLSISLTLSFNFLFSRLKKLCSSLVVTLFTTFGTIFSAFGDI